MAGKTIFDWAVVRRRIRDGHMELSYFCGWTSLGCFSKEWMYLVNLPPHAIDCILTIRYKLLRDRLAKPPIGLKWLSTADVRDFLRSFLLDRCVIDGRDPDR